jgi:hypothetical protein
MMIWEGNQGFPQLVRNSAAMADLGARGQQGMFTKDDVRLMIDLRITIDDFRFLM